MIQTEKLRRNGASIFKWPNPGTTHTPPLSWALLYILRLSYWMGKYCLRRQDLYETSLPSFPELCMWEPQQQQQQQPRKETTRPTPAVVFSTHSRPKSLLPPSHCVCVSAGQKIPLSAIKRKKEFFFFKKIFSLREQIRKPNGEPTVCPFGLEIVCNFL